MTWPLGDTNLKDSVAIFKKEIERLSKNAIQNAIIAWFRHFTSKYFFSSSFQLLDWTKELSKSNQCPRSFFDWQSNFRMMDTSFRPIRYGFLFFRILPEFCRH